jgi:hypothetical protein
MTVKMILKAETQVESRLVGKVAKTVHIIPVMGIQGIVHAHHPLQVLATHLPSCINS